jgi:hypothetical protein
MILKHVWNYRQRDCPNPKDRIFAFLGISIDRQEFPMPYYTRSVKHIYVQYAAYLTRVERSLRILSLCILDTRQMEIPSWVPDRTIDFAACPSRSLTQWHTPDCANSRPLPIGHTLAMSLVTARRFMRGEFNALQYPLLEKLLQEEHARPGSEPQNMWQRLRSWLSVV